MALKELEEASDWYEERAVGLGVLFVEIIYKAFDLIALTPGAYPQKKSNYREFTVNKFPYLVVYELADKEGAIYILHIFHTSRNPKLKYRKR